jgi:hypothetical protein
MIGLGLRDPAFLARATPASSPLLLDIYTGAAAAYSLRHLRTVYTGSCIRVRRSNDNAEQDIGFSGGVIDSASLASFVGSNSGFVTTWYDQSGNGRNMTQATLSIQPRIVLSGTTDALEDVAMIRFLTALNSTRWLRSTWTSTLTAQTVFAAIAHHSSWGSASHWGRVYTQSDNGVDWSTSGTYIPLARQNNTASINSGNAASAAFSYDTRLIATGKHTGTVASIRVNENTPITASNTLNKQFLHRRIGAVITANDGNATSDGWEGWIGEIIDYSADMTADEAAIRGAMNDYWSAY